MRAGSVPASSSRATRSISTRVLPEPALAETQLDAAGVEARTCAAVAGVTARPRVRRVAVGPLAEPRQVVEVAPELQAVRAQPGDIAVLGALVVGDEVGEPRPCLRRRAGRVVVGDRLAGAEAEQLEMERGAGGGALEAARRGDGALERKLQVEGVRLGPARDAAGLVVVDRVAAAFGAVEAVGPGGDDEGQRQAVERALAAHLAREGAGAGAALGLAAEEPAGGAAEARGPDRPHRRPRRGVGEHVAHRLGEERARVRRQVVGGDGDEGVEGGVDGAAARQRVGLAPGRVEPPQAEDLAGVDGVGVRDQPLDGGDRKLGGAGRGRRPRRGPAAPAAPAPPGGRAGRRLR